METIVLNRITAKRGALTGKPNITGIRRKLTGNFKIFLKYFIPIKE